MAFHGSGLTACCIRLISCHLIITCSCYLLSVICRPVIHLSLCLCSCGAVVPKVLQKKGFIIAVRAVRVTESDQRSWEATVLWWISIFKDGLGRGGSGRRQEEAFWASLTLFISSVTERWSPPLMCEQASWLHVVCIHVLILLPLLSQIYWASTVGCVCLTLAVYMNILHSLACKDLFRSVSITELKTREPHSLLLVTLVRTHPHAWPESLVYGYEYL